MQQLLGNNLRLRLGEFLVSVPGRSVMTLAMNQHPVIPAVAIVRFVYRYLAMLTLAPSHFACHFHTRTIAHPRASSKKIISSKSENLTEATGHLLSSYKSKSSHSSIG
jgi:hypothetical protein